MLTQDSEDPAKWLSKDGRIEINYFNASDRTGFWVKVQDFEKESNYYNAEGASASFEFQLVLLDPELTYTTGTEDYMGNWVSQSTGDLYNFTPIASSENVYGVVDYIVTTGKQNEAGELMAPVTTSVMARENDKLEHKDPPYTNDRDDHYVLKSFQTIEYYDANDMVVDTLEKVEE